MLKLFYPASFLPHKRHFLLLDPLFRQFCVANSVQVLLTLPSVSQYNSSPHVVNIGPVCRNQVLETLEGSDALLFLSKFETLGLPLVEAAQAGKPVIAPDLPYVRELLGITPYFLDPLDMKGSMINVLSSIIDIRQNSLLRPASICCALSSSSDIVRFVVSHFSDH